MPLSPPTLAFTANRLISKARMHNFDYTSSTYDPSFAGACQLSLCCGSDGLTILIHDAVSDQLLVCRHFPFKSSGYQLQLRKIRDIISATPLPGTSFGKTTIFLAEKQFALIPEHLYTPKFTELLFPPVKKHEAGLENIVVPVQEAGAFLVFRTAKDLYDYFSLTFPGAGFSHELLPLLHHPSNQEAVLHFHLHDSWFYAVAEENHKIKFANTFEFRNIHDMLYFMLAVTREFNPDNHPVVLSGWMDPADARLDTIRNYFPGIVWTGDGNPVVEAGESKSFRSFYGLFRRL